MKKTEGAEALQNSLQACLKESRKAADLQSQESKKQVQAQAQPQKQSQQKLQPIARSQASVSEVFGNLAS